MKKVVRAVSLMLLMAGVCGNAFAEENENIVRQGTIRGRVIDNGKQILPGASIFIENLKTGVISDVNGFYTLPNLKPGTYTVKVTYVGYSPIEMKVTVPEGKTLGKFYQFNLSSCIRQQNSLTAQFVSFSLSNLANIFYPPQFLQ